MTSVASGILGHKPLVHPSCVSLYIYTVTSIGFQKELGVAKKINLNNNNKLRGGG